MFWLWLTLSTASLATRVKYQEYPCPLGEGDVVRVYELVSSNTQGGYDSDLVRYSSDGQFREYAVSTCANNLFSLMGVDMLAPLPQGAAPELKNRLEAFVSQLPDPKNPTTWQRYEIAAEMYQVLNRPPLEIAEMYLQASWVARDAVVGFHRGLEGPTAVRYLLEQGPKELNKPLTPDQRRAVLYSLARVAHRGGYGAQRQDYLRQFEQVGPLTDGEREAIATFRRIAEDVEPYYQDRAIAWIERALKEQELDEPEHLQATYLLADLSRRRGLAAAARPLYQEVASHPRAPAPLKEMASVLLEDVQPQE